MSILKKRNGVFFFVKKDKKTNNYKQWAAWKEEEAYLRKMGPGNYKVTIEKVEE